MGSVLCWRDWQSIQWAHSCFQAMLQSPCQGPAVTSDKSPAGGCPWRDLCRKKKNKKSGSQRMPQAMACCLGWLTACHSCSGLASFSSDTYQRGSHMRSQDHSLPQRSSCITYLIPLSLPRAKCRNTTTPVSNMVPVNLDLYSYGRKPLLFSLTLTCWQLDP